MPTKETFLPAYVLNANVDVQLAGDGKCLTGRITAHTASYIVLSGEGGPHTVMLAQVRWIRPAPDRAPTEPIKGIVT